MIKRKIHRDMMRESSSDLVNTVKDPIVDWSITELAIIKLKKIKLSSYGDYSGSSTHKHKSGKVITTGWGPTNVDPDDGSYDSSKFKTEYANFNAFLKREIL